MLATYLVPAYAGASSHAAAAEAQIGADATAAAQTLTADTVEAAATELTRDSYTVTRIMPNGYRPYSQTAATFVNNPNSPIQWPFAQGVPISSWFGFRIPPCGGCSSDHKGLDMNPGVGTPVQAIADGVVIETGNPDGSFGVYAIVEHLVEGEVVTSVYAHMQEGSLAVAVGDAVSVGEVIGQVGSTGLSTGAHLHFEIRLGGTEPTDPFAWLTEKVAL